eukprot:907331-Rhodomonas_salina.2
MPQTSLVLVLLFACVILHASSQHEATGEHVHRDSGERLSGVVVSVTTVPDRVDSLGPTLESLLQQTRRVQIVVAIPHTSKRFPERAYTVPQWLQEIAGVRVVRGTDWGPATKLFAPLELMQNATDNIIITVDDDTVYHPQMVENLLAYAEEFPDAVLAHAGHRLFGPEIRSAPRLK